MKPRKSFIMMLLLCTFLLSSCWDYRGMDEINIVSGIAVDRGDDGGFKLTLKLVSVSNMKEGSGSESLLVHAEGATLFEAVRNAKKRLFNKLYFGNLQTIIISRDLAAEKDLQDIIDEFLRDIEPRETAYLVISQEDTAEEIISVSGLDTTNVSYEIARIIKEDHKVDSTSKSVQIYQAYNMVHAPGLELVLPAFHLVKNGDKDAAEINGIAAFEGGKLAGFLSPEEAHYFLMATEELSGGALSFTLAEDDPATVSIDILESKNKTELRFANDKVHIHVTVDMQFGIVEFPDNVFYNESVIKQVQARAEEVLGNRMKTVFQKTQRSLGLDIYGYGNRLFEDQNDLWNTIKDRWPELFQSADFEVVVHAEIVNIGLIS